VADQISSGFVSQVGSVSVEISSSGHSEEELFFFGVLFRDTCVLHEGLLVSALKESVSITLSAKVLSQLLVGADQLLDGVVLRTDVNLFHLMAVDELLQVRDLLSQNLFGGDLASLAGMSRVFFLEDLLLNPELLDDSLERFHKDFKFADGLVSACSDSY